MCCLFGYHSYGNKLSRKQQSVLLSALSVSAEARGTDAAGIAYNGDGKMRIYKRPLPAHLMWWRVPRESTAVMGHTRMSTQGTERRNFNNHPFSGQTDGGPFALAHNGVLYNDKNLRKKLKLPATPVETDSYIAVQLIERYGELSFDSLRFMAEQLEGSFTFTVLSHRDDLYFVVGNNPMCLYHFPDQGIYIYASTEQILQSALRRLPFALGKHVKIHLFSGDLLRIDAYGNLNCSTFDDARLYPWFSGWSGYENTWEDSYIDDLKAVARNYGIYPEDVDALLDDGISSEEIEELIYCG